MIVNTTEYVRLWTETRLARDKLSVARLDSVRIDRPAAQYGADRPAGDSHAFIGCVVAAILQHRMGDRDLALGVPQHDIGIRADGDSAFAGVDAISLGVVGRRQCDEAVEIDASFDDAFREQDRHARGNARYAVRHIAEVRLAARRHLAGRVVEAKRAVVGRKHLEHALLQALPASLLAIQIAWRRAADILGTFHPSTVHILLGEHEILRTGLTENSQAAHLRAPDLFHRLAVGDMNDHDRRIDDLGQADGAMRRLALHGDRTRRAMIVRRGAALAFEPVRKEADRVIALGVDHDQRPMLLGYRKHLEDFTVGELEVVIGHENLDRGEAFGN